MMMVRKSTRGWTDDEPWLAIDASGMSRRGFLATSAAVGVHAASGRMFPGHHTSTAIPNTRVARRMAPSAFLPDPPTADHFRQLAVIAMDAARSAGAEYADIRIGVERTISVLDSAGASLTVGYGIRARIAGVWGFQHGSLLSADAVAASARGAAATARRYAALNTRLGRRPVAERAPAPVVTGEWHVPVAIDPFTVPIDDYWRVSKSLTDSASRVVGNRMLGSGELGWRGETRVFASTDGSLVTQSFMRMVGLPIGGVVTLPDDPNDRVAVELPGLEGRSGGFELVLAPGLVDYVRTGLDEAVRLRALPVRPFAEVGRYPVIFDGSSFGQLVAVTAGAALDADRAAGIEADASGTTFLSPILDTLNATTPHFSALLSMHVDRALPSTLAARWDDEGVDIRPYTVVDRGRVVDYHTTRDTAPLLVEWYMAQGRPLASRGGAMAAHVVSAPSCTGGHLQVSPSTTSASVYDLARELTHGFIVRDARSETEPGLTAGMTTAEFAIEVRNGKPVARTNLRMQFTTKALLKAKLAALGGPESVRTSAVSIPKGVPWEPVEHAVTAPAALCKDVDVLSWTLS